MAENIVVTSIGILSALGLGTDANLHSLVNSQSGLRHPKHLRTIHSEAFLVGEVDLSNDELAVLLGIAPGDNGYTRTTLLALAAMQDLLKNADLELLRKESLAFINANTVGGMCSVEDMYPDFISDKQDGPFVKYIETLDCAESTLNVTRHFGLKPLMSTISTACSSSANALILGARLIQQGVVKRAICGGCDALSRFTLNGFNSLKNVDKAPCRPFDQDRFGLNLGEGAAYLLLETETDAIKRGATILARFTGYSNTNDAYHTTAPEPGGQGAARTMQHALDKAGLEAAAIGYINAHGTATINNDAAEGKAIETLFGDKVPFSSTKPFTGHTLAAAGAVEAVFSIWCLQQGMALPNLNFSTRMEELTISPVAQLVKDLDIKNVLSNSFGFGGSNVSLIFSAA